MSLLDIDNNLDVGIINHTCKLYIKKYGVNTNTQATTHNGPVHDVGGILHEFDSIDNLDKIFVYWTYVGWVNSHLTYKLLITDIVPKIASEQRDVLVYASILIRDNLLYRPCTNRGHLLSLSDIMNKINN